MEKGCSDKTLQPFSFYLANIYSGISPTNASIAS